MFEVKFEIDDERFREFLDHCDEFRQFLSEAGIEIVSGQGRVPSILELLRRRTPRSKEGGPHLADAWTMKVMTTPEGWVGQIIFENLSDKCQGLLLTYLEYGTRPHIIYGRPVLRFKIGSEVIFSAYVRHPGTQPRLFITETVGDLMNRIETFEETVKDVIEKLFVWMTD